MGVIEVAISATQEPRLIHWTRDDYYRLAEAGVFEGRRVELIKGQIYEMSPQKSKHTLGVTRGDRILSAVFEPLGCYVRAQFPLELGADSDPEPDLAVVTGQPEDYADAHPTTAALIVEVADTSLEMDRGRKASLYASAGIAEYWIVNLVGRQLEVYRDPAPDPDQPYGCGYASVTIHTRGEVVSPLAAPGAAVAVADLLP
jgi:Uma2 family endonuclease